MMSWPVVILVGKGRSGKDTAGAVLCEEMCGQAFALADPIKRFFLQAGLTAEQLWGKEKETEIARPEIMAEQTPFWLAKALSYWRTPAELHRVHVEGWLRTLPPRTTPRHLMQTFGTECIRHFDPDFWIDHGLYVADELLAGRKGYDRTLGLTEQTPWRPTVAVITDGRFRNEPLKVKQRGGAAVLLRRPTAGLTDEAAKAHASEREQESIPSWWFNVVVDNDDTLIAFERKLAQLARYDFMCRGSSY